MAGGTRGKIICSVSPKTRNTRGLVADTGAPRDRTEGQDAEMLGSHYKTPGFAFKKFSISL